MDGCDGGTLAARLHSTPSPSPNAKRGLFHPTGQQPAGYRSPSTGRPTGAVTGTHPHSAGPAVSASPIPVLAELITPNEQLRRAEHARMIHQARAATATMGSGPPTLAPSGYHISVARKKSPIPTQLAAPPPQPHRAQLPTPTTPSPRVRRKKRGPSLPAAASVAPPISDVESSMESVDDGRIHVETNAVQRSGPPPAASADPLEPTPDAVPRAEQSFEISDTESSDDSDAEATFQKNRTANDLSRRQGGTAKLTRVELSLTRKTPTDTFGFDLSGGYGGKYTVLYTDGDSVGVHVRDQIVSVNGEDATKMDPDDLEEAIQGSTVDRSLRLDLVVLRAPPPAPPTVPEAVPLTTAEEPAAGAPPAPSATPHTTVKTGVMHMSGDPDDSSDEELTLMPPPVFASGPRSGLDEEAAVPAHKAGKFTAEGHAAVVRAQGATGSAAESRMMTLAMLLGVVVLVLCAFMLMATSSNGDLVNTFHFGAVVEGVTNSSQFGQAMLGLRFVRLRYNTTGPHITIKYDSAVCSDADPIFDSHLCTACKDAGQWSARLIAGLLVLGVIRLDILSPRRRAKGNILLRRVFSVLISIACIVVDVMVIYSFREDCLLQWEVESSSSTTYGPGVVLCCLTIVLDTVSLFVSCAIPHTFYAIK